MMCSENKLEGVTHQVYSFPQFLCTYLSNVATVSHTQQMKDAISKIFAGSRLLYLLLINRKIRANKDMGITEK